MADKDLLYVVTGASRGLGLEFVTQVESKTNHLTPAALKSTSFARCAQVI